MNFTEFLKLKKPEKNESVLIDDFNENADSIDAELKKQSEALEKKADLGEDGKVIPSQMPDVLPIDGEAGQILAKNAEGVIWKDNVSSDVKVDSETASIVWNGSPPAEPNVSGALAQVNQNIALGTPKLVLLAEAVIPPFETDSAVVTLATAGSIEGNFGNIVFGIEGADIQISSGTMTSCNWKVNGSTIMRIPGARSSKTELDDFVIYTPTCVNYDTWDPNVRRVLNVNVSSSSSSSIYATRLPIALTKNNISWDEITTQVTLNGGSSANPITVKMYAQEVIYG